MTPPIKPEDISAYVDAQGSNLDVGALQSLYYSPQGKRLPDNLRQTINGVLSEVAYRQRTGKTNVYEQGKRMSAVTAMPRINPSGNDDAAEWFQFAATETAKATQEQGLTPQQADQYYDSLAKQPGIASAIVGQQFAHDMSAGIISAPTVPVNTQPEWDSQIKPIVDMTAMLYQGHLLVSGLGLISKLPASGMILERLAPKIVQAVNASTAVRNGTAVAEGVKLLTGTGASVGDIVNATVSPLIQRVAVGGGVNVALGLLNPNQEHTTEGAVKDFAIGAAAGELLMGIAQGFNVVKTYRFAQRMTPEMEAAIKQSLSDIGVAVPSTSTKYNTAKLFSENLSKISLDARLAGVAAEQSSREALIMQQALGSKTLLPESDDARYMSAIMQSNTGAPAVAAGVTDLAAIDQITKNLGYDVDVIRVRRGTERVVVGAPVVAGEMKPPVPTVNPEATQGPPIPQPTPESLTPAQRAAFDKAEETRKALGTTPGNTPEPTVQPLPLPANPVEVKPVEEMTPVERRVDQLYSKLRGFEEKKARGVPVDPLEQQATTDAYKLALHDLGQERGAPVGAEFAPTEEGAVYDVLLSRPRLVFGSAADLARDTKTRAATLAKVLEANATKASMLDAYLLPDGRAVGATVDVGEIRRRVKIPDLMVAGKEMPDIALREATGSIKVSLKGKVLSVDLPTRVTDEQMQGLSRFFDNTAVQQVVITHPTATSAVIDVPMSAQVQDKIAEMVGNVKRESAWTPEMVKQFKETGVFEGQAAITQNGLPVRVMKQVGNKIEVADPLRGGTRLRFKPENLTVLPYALEGQLKPTNLFTQYLPAEEQEALARMRKAILSGFADKIATQRDLEQFAGAHGYTVTADKGGQVILNDLVGSGEALNFKSRRAAIAYLEKNIPVAPDMTPAEVKSLLGGETNIGQVLPSTAPSKFGAVLDIPRQVVIDNALKFARDPQYVNSFINPSRALFLNLQENTGLPWFQAFDGVQTQTVLRQNFVSRWALGTGEALPPGVMPFEKIVKMAGTNPDAEAITAWLEGNRDIEKAMTPSELGAAKELRKWYDALFSEFGIPADYLENYAPHYRKWADQYSNNIDLIAQRTGIRIPKGADFFADNLRTGNVNIYELDAFKSAVQYLHAGASNRYMSDVLDQVGGMMQTVREVRSAQGIKPLTDEYHMAHFLEALRGFEFYETQGHLSEAFKALFQNLPSVSEKQAGTIGTNLVDALTGMATTATMAYKIPSVLRNLFQVMQTTYPLLGMSGGRFTEALGLALTQEGKLMAQADGAISVTHGAIPYRMEVEKLGDISPKFKRVADMGFKLYDNADHFTRAATYHAFRMQAEDAIAEYAAALRTSAPGNTGALRQKLLSNSGASLFDEPIQQEFLRRLERAPQSAAGYLGKQGSDFTQFLYGRGMQPRWLRHPVGKFFGQFAAWPLAYADYLTRTTSVLYKTGQTAKLAQFFARTALLAGAVTYAGIKSGMDLGRWYAHPALFYSGGPGFQVLVSGSQVLRGVGRVSEGDPAGQQALDRAKDQFLQDATVFLPFSGFARDMGRLADAMDERQFVAAVLGGKVRNEAYTSQIVDAINAGTPLGPTEWRRYQTLQDGTRVLRQPTVGAQSAPTQAPPSPMPNPISQVPVPQLPTARGQSAGMTVGGSKPILAPLPKAGIPDNSTTTESTPISSY